MLDADVPLAIDVLCDMVTSSLMPTHEVESERGVILEEIAMHDDDPDDVIHDAFVAQLYGDTPLGRSITGSVESINALTRRQIHGYYRRRYTADNLVFAAAGNVDHARRRTPGASGVRACRRAGRPEPPACSGADAGPAGAAHTGAVLLERPTEQTSFVLGMPAYARNDPRRFALAALNATVGGGTSSRLFQEVRERRGLAYTIYSFTSQHVDAGYFAVAGGCLPDRVDDVLAICRDELAKVAASGVTIEELARAKGQIRGGLVMGLEDSSARMSRIGKAEVVPGGVLSIDESLARIDAVTLDDVHAVARDILDATPTLAVLGPAKALAASPADSAQVEGLERRHAGNHLEVGVLVPQRGSVPKGHGGDQAVGEAPDGGTSGSRCPVQRGGRGVVTGRLHGQHRHRCDQGVDPGECLLRGRAGEKLHGDRLRRRDEARVGLDQAAHLRRGVRRLPAQNVDPQRAVDQDHEASTLRSARRWSRSPSQPTPWTASNRSTVSRGPASRARAR